MIQSIQANSTAFYNSTNVSAAGRLSIDNAKKTADNTQDEDENTTVSANGDTVTISNAGVAAAKTFTGESANRASNGLTDEGYTDATASAISSATSEAGINEYTSLKSEMSADSAAVSGSSSSSDSSSSSSLSSYSEAELKEMLEDGEITRAEYEKEISSRKENDEDSEDENQTVANTNETEA